MYIAVYISIYLFYFSMYIHACVTILIIIIIVLHVLCRRDTVRHMLLALDPVGVRLRARRRIVRRNYFLKVMLITMIKSS